MQLTLSTVGSPYRDDEQPLLRARYTNDSAAPIKLAPGRYTITLVFESPPAHGFVQHAPDPREFRGRVESNAVPVTIAAAPPRKKLLGIF